MKRGILLRIAVILAMLGAVTSGAGALQKYWIIFADKGPSAPASGVLTSGSAPYEAARASLSPRALARRAKVLPADELITADDLPIYPSYVARIEKLGGRIVHEVRWMNAVSAFLDDGALAAVRQLPFVRQASPVLRLRAPKEPDADAPSLPSAQKSSSLDYGPSLGQDEMVNVPILHDLGINGKGVLIGMLDTGVRWRLHEALKTRDILAEYDFVNNDSVTENQAGDSPAQHNHGTLTFSIIAGYMPGKLIGPAYAAQYLLAKTEYYPAELAVEEDHWAAGLEWMENLGADLASSSLGYNVFDNNTGYFWANGDFNGRTSVTAKAAIHAARLGMVVVDAMGNEGKGDGFTGTMLTPADADSIISVGAVSFSRYLAGFSSTGPTNDGRIKPDVVAPGVGVYFALASGASSYGTTNGTSLATPLAAGAAALLLSARPELTPIQVRDALRETADSIDAADYPERPNNFTGWGLVNAFNAVLSFGPIFSNEPTVSVSGGLSVVTTTVVSKFGITPGSVILRYTVGTQPFLLESRVEMTLDAAMVFPTSGRYSAVLPPQAEGTLIRFVIDATDSGGHAYESPAPIRNATWQLHYGLSGVGTEPPIPVTTELRQNYPNPFNPATKIDYRIAGPGFVTLRVYNVLGEEVATLVDREQPAGFYTAAWNAAGLPSGVYFYRLSASSLVMTRKMVLLR